MRRIALLGIAGLAGIALAGMTSQPRVVSDDTHARSDLFWGQSWLNAMEIEVFSSLEEMATSVDRIVQGRVVGVRPGRDFSNKFGPEVAKYAAVTIAVDRSIKGPVTGTVDIEVFFPSKLRYENFLSSPVPGEAAVFFIRNKGTHLIMEGEDQAAAAAEQPYNALVNLSQSLFRNIGGRVHTQNSAEGDFTHEWEGRPFDALLAALAK